MLTIDLKDKINSPVPSDYIYGKVTITQLSDMGEAVALLTAGINSAGVYKLSEIIPKIRYRDVNYTDEYATIKALDMVIGIANTGATDTDYGYMISMLDGMRDSYGSIETSVSRKAAMTTTIELTPINNDLAIDVLLLTLIEALGFQGAMITLKVLLPYDLLD